MSQLIKVGTCLLALAGFASCGPIEFRISKAEGVRPLNRTFTANINSDSFRCGDTIIGEDSTQEYVVHTAPVNGGCQYTFDQEVEVLSEADYDTIEEFRRTVRYVNRVEIEVQRLDFYDEVGDRFEVETRIRDMEFWVNGEQVLDREKIGNLPQTVVIQGDGLQAIKDAVKNRKRCTAHVQAKVTVLDAKPSSIRCELESQPTFILSTAEL